MRPLALALGCLLLTGCPTSPVCELVPAPMSPQRGPFWADDSGPVLVMLAALQGFSCEEEGPEASTVTGSVLSPTNVPLPVTAEPEVDPGTGNTVGARLVFTPSEGPGTYLATATFLPVGGRPSVPVLVVNDRRRDPAAFRFPTACTSVARLSTGAWACDGRVYRPGADTEVVFQGFSEVGGAGGTLWAQSDNVLRAWQDRDGGMQPLGEFPTGYLNRVVALEDRAVLFGAGGTQVVTVEDGGLRSAGTLQAANDDARLPTVRGDRLYLPEADAFLDSTGASSHNVCTVALDPAVPSRGDCTALKGRVVGGWDGVYLSFSDESGTLWAWAPGADGGLLLVDSLSLPANDLRLSALNVLEQADERFSGHWPQLTDLTDAALVARVRSGKIVVEHLPPMPSGLSAQKDATWGRLENGGTGAWPNLP